MLALARGLDRVVAIAAVNGGAVGAVADRVVAFAAVQRVLAEAAGYLVVARIGVDRVVAAFTRDRILAVNAANDVVGAEAYLGKHLAARIVGPEKDVRAVRRVGAVKVFDGLK